MNIASTTNTISQKVLHLKYFNISQASLDTQSAHPFQCTHTIKLCNGIRQIVIEITHTYATDRVDVPPLPLCKEGIRINYGVCSLDVLPVITMAHIHSMFYLL